ncbi:DNA repair protein [Alcaligenes aquatilis]|uniref:DNA repair protein n=1 Tax=Alcaligenes aquatilis TaxID=323284 RepID=UPI001F0BB553|nr:DNA repair protein [Alcaligenes aquatilis]
MKQPFLSVKATTWLTVLLLAAPCIAAAQSMEDRLRTQLRNTTQQLQQVQSERAQLDVEKRAAETARDAANKELAALRAEVGSLRKRASLLEEEKGQAQARIASSRQQTAQVQEAYETLHGQASALQSEANELKVKLAERDSQYQQAVVKNEEMYQAGRELLAAYEAFGTGDLIAIRQPFSGRARVLFDEKAQEFGDRLYQSQVSAGAPPHDDRNQ